jgi:hypothetical protein
MVAKAEQKRAFAAAKARAALDVYEVSRPDRLQGKDRTTNPEPPR